MSVVITTTKYTIKQEGRIKKKQTVSELKVTNVAVCSLVQWAPQSRYMNLLKANMKNHSCLFFFFVNGFQWKVFCNLYEGWWVYYSKLSTTGSEVNKENLIWSYYSIGERPELSLTQNVLKRRTDYSLGAVASNWKRSRGCFWRGGIGEAKAHGVCKRFSLIRSSAFQTLPIKVRLLLPREEGVRSGILLRDFISKVAQVLMKDHPKL